jgi:hypothetical protein
MSAQSIEQPYPIFTDADGDPLENGYIWIGAENLYPIANPVAVYWDAALTQPAVQPIRTQGGYPVNNGTPAALHVAGAYSILVQDRNGMLVYSALSETVLTNSAGVTFLQAGLGAVTRTALAKMREVVSVLDFGADPTGAADSSAAAQAAINTVEAFGGSVVFPPGRYLFTSQVTIDRTYAANGADIIGERNLIISGYGAEIRTTGAITAFDVRGGWLPNHNCLIEGFTIYHRGNTQAVGGIRMIGAGLVTCREVSVVVSSSLPAGYGAFILENVDPADPGTGCFWCLIDQCSIRPWAGAEGFCDYGVKASGAANALTLRNNTFSGSDIHVALTSDTGQTYAPNAVNIDGNFFEGPVTSRGIRLFTTAPTYHVSGCRITNNRFEAILTAVLIEGTPATVQLPTYMSGNYADTSVTNYVVNTSGVPIVMLDSALVGSPMGPAKMYNADGIVFQNENSAFDPVTAVPANVGKGFALKTAAGALLGRIRYRSSAVGAGMEIAGSYTPDYYPLTLVGCQGIAARDTSANNLAGTATFAAATTVAVTLPIAETNANYLIFFDNPANQTLWVTSKTASGFTINSSVSNSTTVGWLLIRHL